MFTRYLLGLNKRIAEDLDFDPADNKAQRALTMLAAVFAEQGTRAIERSEAEGLINPLVPTVGFANSLYRALVTTGLLIESPGWWNQTHGERISIAFERFADHLIASHLLDVHVDSDQPYIAFGAGGGLAFLASPDSHVPSGLLEAMFIQVPERTGAELFSFMPALSASTRGASAFLDSLVWRRSDSFSKDTRSVLDDLVRRPGNELGHEVLETLLTVATIPEHPFNADYLDDVLRRYDLADRDAIWATYLHNSYGTRGAIDRLLDWATTLQSSTTDDLEDEVIDLYSIALAWMLTTSDRFVRDRATKSLVAVLSRSLPATMRLVARFAHVDDPYVKERVYAVAYGVAMRSYDSAGVGQLATLVYDLIFSSGTPPPHILLRDYARGVIERALYLGAAVDIDKTLVRPPYRSTWPHIPTATELESLAPPSRGLNSGWSDPDRSKHLIYGSVMSLDFARYVIGTDHPMREWLSHRLKDAPWRSPADRMAALESALNASAREALAELSEAEGLVPLWLAFYDRDMNVSKSTFVTRGAPGMATSERDYEQAVSRVEDARSRFRSTVNAAQSEEYSSIVQARDADDDYFDSGIIQRYVLWRVFDLGWTVERFGRFDSSLSHRFQGRNADKPERIGKKYQWIAYHEILAYISDHYQYRDRYEEGQDAHHYRGPWQTWCRDIDPSSTLLSVPTGDPPRGDVATWWAGALYSSWHAQLDRREWLTKRDDIPDVNEILRVVRPSDGSRWINVRAMLDWRQFELPDEDEHEMDRREVWIHATGYFVDASAAVDFVTWFPGADFGNDRMPQPPTANQLFFGEHGWSPAFTETFATSLKASTPTFRDGVTCPTGVRVTAVEYQARGSEFDCSVRDNYSLSVPPPALIQALGLRWSGHGADFVDQSGNLAAFDPTAHEYGPAGLLLREDLLGDYLEREGLALVWTVNGEKLTAAPGRDWRWDGILHFSGAYRYASKHVTGELAFREEPSVPDEGQ